MTHRRIEPAKVVGYRRRFNATEYIICGGGWRRLTVTAHDGGRLITTRVAGTTVTLLNLEQRRELVGRPTRALVLAIVNAGAPTERRDENLIKTLALRRQHQQRHETRTAALRQAWGTLRDMRLPVDPEITETLRTRQTAQHRGAQGSWYAASNLLALAGITIDDRPPVQVRLDRWLSLAAQRDAV